MITLQQIMVVAFAGAIGCVLRFILAQNIQQYFTRSFPLGILVVNVLGCWLMGFLATLFLERFNVSANWRIAILVGFLGGFTTFSSFSIDTINLLQIGEYDKAFLYIFLSVCLCLLATWLGMVLGRNL